jgi:hypothetical protein
MALITDPDLLKDNAVDSAGASIYIDTSLRTIKVRNNSASPKTPVLSNDGVTLQALYSFLKEEWKDDPNSKDLIAYPFPLVAITPEQFEFRFGWTPADDSSRSLLRTGGWREFDVDNTTLKREYIGTISLGNIQGEPNQDNVATINQHTVYYAFFDSANGTAKAGPFDYDYAGEANQAVQTLDSTSFDRRGDILRLFIRSTPFQAPQSTLAWTFDQTDTTDIGLSAGTTLPYNVQRFPLVEQQDLNLSVSDATIQAAAAAGQKYSLQGDGPTIEYLATSEASNTFGYAEDLLDGPYDFGIKINASGGTGTNLTNPELYSWVQYQLRQDSDIEFAAGTTKIGKLQDELVTFVGSTLTTKLATNADQSGTLTGVAITSINAADINNTQLRDDNDTLRSFPFSTAVQISFSQDILNDGANAKVFVFYDYTRGYVVGDEIGTSVTISNVGPNGSQDSANFTLAGTTFTPVLTVQNANGLNPALDADAYFRVHKSSGTGGNHNVIWKITSIFDSNNFAAITLDDTVVPVNETLNTAGDAIRTHPINSPASLLLDSAAATSENNITQAAVSTLATGNLTDGIFEFTYAFDNNSQKDRLNKVGENNADNVAVNVRAIGLESGTWVQQTSTLTRVNTNSISVVSPVERNYSNP